MGNETLTALVQKAAAGDKLAFDALYKAKIRGILYQASQIVGNHADAEDVAQEVVYKMYANIHKLRDPERFNTWLHSIVTNECNMMLRKKYMKKRQVVTVDDIDEYEAENRAEFLPPEFSEDAEKRQAVLDAINKLPPKRKNVVFLYYFEGLSSAEIAEVTGTTIGAVTSSMTKAKAAIAEELQDRYGNIEMKAVAKGIVVAPVLKMVLDSHSRELFPNSTVNEVVRACEARITASASAAQRMPKRQSENFWLGAKVAAVSVMAIAAIIASSAGIKNTLLAETTQEPSPIVELGSDTPTFEPYEMFAQSIRYGEIDKTDPLVMRLGGTVTLVDGLNETVLGSGISVEGIGVVLTDRDGVELARATTNNEGAFSFGDVSIYRGSRHYIALTAPEGDDLLAIATREGFRVGFVSAEEPRITVHVSVTQTPKGKILALAGGADCNHYRPESISFVSDRVVIQSSQWVITHQDAAEALYIGEGTSVSSAALNDLLTTGGSYTVAFSVTDVFGNKTEIKYDFSY